MMFKEPKVIYVSPDYDDILGFERQTDESKLHIARNDNNMRIYSLDEFAKAFNDEMISDQGFIYIIR